MTPAEHFTFNFVTRNEDDGATTSVNTVFSGDFITHTALAEKFTNFLRQVGYIFDDGLTLKLVPEDSSEF